MTKPTSKKRSTQTSSFGTSGRVSHDSTRFYDSRLYEGLRSDAAHQASENPLPVEVRDQLFCKSSERMDEIPDNSVHLMVITALQRIQGL
jgi:site-specific DNA-methyltransferase (adenine-specific)